jgi:threonine dehydrogenase-like Zn-dependent dehydrogenase
MGEQNTIKIDGKLYDINALPDVAKIAIEHLMAIEKNQQRLEMARAGFAQAVKNSMEGDDAPEPIEEPEKEETAEFVPEEA